MLLAPEPTAAPSIIPAERAGRAAAESHRRALRRLAEIGLVELTWKSEIMETTRKKRTGSLIWDREAGVHREVRPQHIPSERLMKRRAVRLTALGSYVVDRLRPDLETGERIRWSTITDPPSR